MRGLVCVVEVVLMVAVPAMGVGPSDPGGSFVDDDSSVHQGAIEAIAMEGKSICRRE